MSERTDHTHTELLHLSPAERDERGISTAAVREALIAVAREGDEETKDLRGVHLPPLSLDRVRIEGTDRHALDLREATVEGLSLDGAAFGMPLRLDGAEIGDLSLDEATIHGDLDLSDSTITGELSGFETTFRGDVTAERARFAGPVTLDEAAFEGDVSFDDATFEATVEMRAATLSGDSNLLDDNSSFAGATFEAGFDVRQTEFGFTHFERIRVEGPAKGAELVVDGDVEFTGAEFTATASFPEIRVTEDAAFDDVTFEGPVTFDGAQFRGGERTQEADATFEGTVFGDDASFAGVSFRGAVFDDARFDGPAGFAEASFDGDARFDGVRFAAHADFHAVSVGTVSFRDTVFGGGVDLTDGQITERIEMAATGSDDALVNLTRASVVAGRIVQPADEWLAYDLTRASLGEVELETTGDRGNLLDSFRFCLTEFTEFDGDEFDFGRHLASLDRTDYTIHEFAGQPASSHSVEMTSEVTATTYLNAKQAAQANGEAKIAGEFRVKRQRFAREENLRVARDSEAAFSTRVKNFGRAAENYFLDATCGHGMRPLRIAGAFLVAPLVVVPLYAFGGTAFATSAGQLESLSALATPEGRATFVKLIHFSYVSYTTIGYGNIGPTGVLARLLAVGEAFLSVLLSALFVYALVKRSEL